MSHLARLSLANRTIVALISLIVVGFGFYSIPQLKQQLIPNIEFPAAFVVAPYAGAAPDIVEDQVTVPIEEAVQGVDGVEEVTSTSADGAATIQLQFTYGTDLDEATADVEEAVAGIQSQLPEDVEPEVANGSSDQIPAVVFAATSDLDQQELADRLDETVVPELTQVSGVRSAEVTGVREQQLAVSVDEKELAEAGLTTQAVADALTANGTPVPAGSFDDADKKVAVQVAKRFETVGEVEDIYVTPSADAPGGPQPPAKPVQLGDVADVSLTEAEATTLTRTNGKPSLGLLVTAAPDGNNVQISDEIRGMLPDLTDEVGGDTELTVVFDQAPYVKDSINSLGTEGVLGLVFAVVVILLFLLSLRSTLVTAVSIPMSVLIALIAMWTGDLSLNLLTLGGLTVAVGRVVDDSIVVLENIKRHLTYGEAKQQAVLDGVREVATAITASTLTTVAVFLPIGLVGGMTGELFRPFALTVTIALLASLFVALTIIPVLCYWFLRAPRIDAGDAAEHERKAVEKERRSLLQRAYVPVITFTTRHRVVTVVLALLILGGTGVLGTQLKTNFLDDSGQNAVTITQKLPVGTNLDTTSDAVAEVEDVLLDDAGVADYQVTVGGGAFGGPGGDPSSANYQVTLRETVAAQAVQDRLRREIGDLGDVGTVTVGGGQGGGPGASSQLQVVVQSPDEDDLRTAARQVRDTVADLDDVTDVTSDLADTAPRVEIETKRSTAARYGLTDSTIGQAVAAAMRGSTVTQMSVDSQQHDVVLTTDGPPKSLAELKELKLPTPAGEVRLDEVASVTRTTGPFSISHVDGARSATVSATPTGDNTGAVSAALTRELAELDLPASAKYSIGGVSADQSEAFSSLFLALAAAVLIVFVIMAATFRSLAQPLILMVSVPFAATGAIGLLLATDTALGVPALIGVLMLVGIVVTNAIVLVDLMNRYRVAGMDVHEAVVEGGRRRLRPVLMTALATICALIPMALGVTGHDGAGFISQSLAIVVIGGLVSSTVLTLVVVPTLYAALELRKERRRNRRQARHAARQATPAETPMEELMDEATDEPTADEPAADHPAADQPVADGPVTDGPVTDGAVADQPLADEPAQSDTPPEESVPAGESADEAGQSDPVAENGSPEPATLGPVVPMSQVEDPPMNGQQTATQLPRWAYDRVGAALDGENPTVLTRLEGGFVAIGDVQFLPGYCVLLTDDPDATRLTDLPRSRRLQFLADVERLGEAVQLVCARRDSGFRRINIEIQGNEDGFLHAHVWPRFDWEPEDVRHRPVGRYPDERWADPVTTLGPQHDELRAELVAELDRLVYDPARPPETRCREQPAETVVPANAVEGTEQWSPPDPHERTN